MRWALAVLLAGAGSALAQSPPASLAVTGHVAHPRSYGAADLAGLPVMAADEPGSHGAAPSHVTGVALWPLLEAAGWVDAPGRKTHLQHVVLARGRDGYAVALSIGELDPGFEGKAVMVVTSRDGKPASELFVPGDAKAGRRVHDLTSIDVQ